MARMLKVLAMTMGVACVLIGCYHLLLGIWSVPGETHAGATVDSRERFYNAIFLGYGLAWVWAARQTPVPVVLVRALAWVFWLAAAGRVLSVAVHGWPQWFQVVLTGIEIVVPPIFLWLARDPAGPIRATQRQ